MRADNGSAWPAVSLALLAGLVVVLVVFHAAFAGAVAIWNQSAAHQFSYLVVPISLYFVWLRRNQLVQMVPAPDMRMIWLMVPCGLVWLASHAAQIDVGVQLAAVGMLQILTLALLGWPVCRALLFPLLFLWLLVPFGDSLTVPLMELTSAMTVAGLTLIGLDVRAEGALLIAEGAPYLIVEECAALDFIIGNLVISLVYANLMFNGARKRWLYTVCAVPVAIVANGLRTTSIVFITHASDGAIDLARDHAVYGWFVFLLAVAAQMWAGWRHRDPPAQTFTASQSPAHRNPPLRTIARTWLVAVLAMTAAPGYAALTAERMPREVALCWPALPSGYEPVTRPDWRPRFVRPDGQRHVQATTASGSLDLYIAYYWRQQRGAELISWQNRVYDGARWNFLARATDTLTVDGRALRVTRDTLRGPRYETRTVFYWYWVDGELLGNAWLAKLAQIKASLLYGDKRAALVALSVDERVAAERVRDVAQSFLNRSPFVVRTLERVRTTATAGECVENQRGAH